jgi:hypothetical protein
MSWDVEREPTWRPAVGCVDPYTRVDNGAERNGRPAYSATPTISLCVARVVHASLPDALRRKHLLLFVYCTGMECSDRGGGVCYDGVQCNPSSTYNIRTGTKKNKPATYNSSSKIKEKGCLVGEKV